MHDYAHHCFGIGISLLALFLIFGALRHRRFHRMYGYHGYYGYAPGPGCGPYGFDGYGPHAFGGGFGRHRFGFGLRGGMLRHLFARLDTSPGQEKAIRAIFDEARQRVKDAKDADAQAFLDTLRNEVARVHAAVLETLDDKQKKLLAELIAARF